MAATHAARITRLETDFAEHRAEYRADMAEIKALLGARLVEEPAKAEVKAKVERPARLEGKRCLTRKNRKEFVKAHAWAEGLSTKAIAAELASGRRRAVKGWALGEGYKALAS